MPRGRPRPPSLNIPSGLEQLTGDPPAPVTQEQASSRPAPVPPREADIRPRRRGDMAPDREIKFFAYLSSNDADTLRQLAERWGCSRSEVLRVLLRRARQQVLD